MRYFSKLALLAAATLLTPSALAAPKAGAATDQSVPIAGLVKQVSIPHTSFTLGNGLKVIVHEDHKAPVAAVTVWYNVGSKDEPKGKTGFAHLFEHLMFNGSENLPGDYFNYLQQIGANDYNGTTNNDRTNYFETVPAGALERAMFMESDRMGHLLGAVTQGVLDNQRGVVQNEKRQGDSRPGGLVQYQVSENLFPEGHPYHHSVIGSMQDLDAASLGDVKQWFRDKYGPNNAVLVVAGDVDPSQVRRLAEKYFGPIPRGPVNRPALAAVPTLSKPKFIAMKDAVATTSIQKYWPVPGLLDRRLAAIDIGASVLGGLASSRLDKIMVRDEQIAVAVSSGLYPMQRVGMFTVSAYVKPGVDPALVSKRLDEIIADFVANGPTQDEVQRAVMSEVSGRIRGLEQVGGFGGKAVSLAEGQTFAGDSNFYKKTLASYAAITPAAVRAQMREWLKRPALTVTLSPGERDASYQEAKAVAEPPAGAGGKSAGAASGNRAIPAVGQLASLDFPEIVHARLTNGMEVRYARRTAVPMTQVGLVFDAGSSADTPQSRGLAQMTMGLLDEGTSKLSSQEFAEAQERLGASIGSSNGGDRAYVMLGVLSPNLKPALGLMMDVVKDPAFREKDIGRVRTELLTAIAQQQKDQARVAQRLLPSILYGPSHPYGGPPTGDPAAIAKFTRADLVAFRDRWLRPDNAKLFIVSDRPLAELQPLLESRFGDWAAPTAAKGVKAFTAPPKPSSPKILLINRPGAPQANIVGAQLLPVDPKSDIVPLDMANDVLGGEFTSRLNMDLRETRGWSYGVDGDFSVAQHAVPYFIGAPVQADRTADSLAVINADLTEFLTAKGVTEEELNQVVANSVNRLPGEFETGASVLGAMIHIDVLSRPDNYYETLAAKYRAQTRASLDQAARAAINPKGFTWVVVGDAAKLRPELEKLGMPIELVEVP